ncbi:hypothetical protein [Paenibacillus rhizophilus]|uniref:Uncharacterized protein n=1 Tax=Paenibacillus rhizophilus TaxID=1850366 RepID=A0A3N9P357_9BACL|nr:hypothetical protein [Paenibacillus rhizophilus]RQW09514.1 hypothetical protein EH198_18740 [Paenibacillus rhizophilus]
MNVWILLFGLLSPLFAADSPAQNASLNADGFGFGPQTVLAAQNAAGETENKTENKFIRSFESLAGVSLYSSEEELAELKGEPLEVVPDPWQNSLEYRYADMSAGISDGVVVYVHVSPQQARNYGLRLNAVKIDPVHDTLQETLGSPDFVAEDGDVYMRGSTALKIYRSEETGEWDGIDLFDDYSS